MKLQRKSPEWKNMRSRMMIIIITLLILTFCIDFHTILASYSLSPQESPYKLPYPAGKTYKVTQGNFGEYSHSGKAKYAFDFDHNFDGNEVVAARNGRVLYVKDDSNEGGNNLKYLNKANYVVIDHGDGTSALYLHLQYKSVVVKEGQDVEQGQIIARADSTGYVTAAHLHFQIQETGTNWYTQSIQISFSDVDVLSKEKDGVPKQGKSYKSDNTLADSHLEVRGKILFMRSYFDENGRLCPGDLCAINPDGTGKTIIFQSAHIKLRSAPIEIEGKRDYSVSSPYLVVSSDGKNMAMTWWKEIIIGGLDAKELNRIPIPESIEPYLSLAWSPDRKKFALIASTKNEINSIYIVNHDGSGLTKVATGFIDLAWSPDSQEIIFNTNSGMLSTVRVDGANRRDLGIIGFTPAWSPDKKKIAYVSAVSSPPKKPVYDLYVLEIESGRVNRLTSESPGVNILNPIWSPDGKKIAFEKLVGLGETVDAIVWSRRAGTSSTIWVIDADGGNPVQLTPLEKENSEMLNILLVWVSKQSNPLTEDMTIAWGKKVSPEFKAKVMEISSRLGVDVNYLMAAMAFETGRTFDPSITNPNSGATGLIQFMPSTALNLGTTTDALRVMGAVEQLDYVEKYFQPYRGRLATLEDVYMAILWPQAIGKPVDYVLFAKPSIYYTQNSGLDLNKDGQVTKAEASAKVKNSLMEGLDSSNKG